MDIQELVKDKSTWTSLIIGVLCGGLSYWFQPYGDRFVLGINIYLLLGILTFTGALLTGLAFKKPGGHIPFFLCAGVLMAVMGRVFYDITFIDKTHHNLWPLEILFVLGVVVPATLAATALVYLILKMIR